MHRVHLNAVHARFLAKPRRFGKGVDKLLYLLFGKGAALDVLRPPGRQFAGRSADMLNIYKRLHQNGKRLVFQKRHERVGYCKRPAEARRKLYEQLCARLVDFVHKFFQLSELALALIQPFSHDNVAQRRNAGDNKPHVVARYLPEQICRFLVEMVGLHPAEKRRAAHGTHDYSVFDLYVPYLPGGKQCGILFVHKIPPYPDSVRNSRYHNFNPSAACCQYPSGNLVRI